jgi:protein-L-isoaspartate(D-aspartate) O-methyltransferase
MLFGRRGDTSGRERMIREHLEARGIHDSRVLDAFRKIAREEFIPEDVRNLAYEDRPLAIGEGQTISQPYITALMTQSLEVQPTDKILEIGTGSGYQTAILASLGREVITIERYAGLMERARERLGRLGYKNIKCLLMDGSLGWDSESPFDRILVTAAAPSVPTPLIEQLSMNGVLVLPVGDRDNQKLKRLRKSPSGVTLEDLCGCVFVPLVGRGGFEE